MCPIRRTAIAMALTVLLGAHSVARAAADPDTRAAVIVRQMTPAERLALLHGIMAIPFVGHVTIPPDAVYGAGYVPGIPRLGIPALKESDASLGVAYVNGLRKDGATALPSGMAMAASWDPQLLYAGGAMIAGEAAAKGFNVLLAGGSNLMRDPRNGRTFEYLGEDPWLTGTLAGAAVSGIQSQHVISTLKHFALNDQETDRHSYSADISDSAARESDLLAFEIALERGHAGAVMCAYNRVNGAYACGNGYLLDRVLKRDWGFRGWVMSDWGAVSALDFALAGLDQESGAQLDRQVFFGEPLARAAQQDPVYAARVADMDRRILRSIFAVGLDTHPAVVHPIDFAADGAVAERLERAGIVLLRNRDRALPLSDSLERVAVIGGYADAGVLSGGGSSQVQGPGGPSIVVPLGGGARFAPAIEYQRSVPLQAIEARLPRAQVVFRDGRYVSQAVQAARWADVAIVFATQWMSEGHDVPDLSLPDGQDALIAAVAAANPHTIVVLETGGPVLMPWLQQTAAVLEAWYPGARGADAISAVLFGDQNPSGRLPVTFPLSLAQLPRPMLPGSGGMGPQYSDRGSPGQTLHVDYDIEGADVGYRWFARTHQQPLFAFGYGLSYTRFETHDLKVTADRALSATCEVVNTGSRAGADVVQLYLVSAAGHPERRLVGYQRVQLQPGQSQRISLTVDPRLIAEFRDGAWRVVPGHYRWALGTSALDTGAPVDTVLGPRQIRP